MHLIFTDILHPDILHLFSGRIRKCAEDTVIKGVQIPAGAFVTINPDAVHMNPDLWGPEPVTEYCPERSVSRCLCLSMSKHVFFPLSFYFCLIFEFYFSLSVSIMFFSCGYFDF